MKMRLLSRFLQLLRISVLAEKIFSALDARLFPSSFRSPQKMGYLIKIPENRKTGGELTISLNMPKIMSPAESM